MTASVLCHSPKKNNNCLVKAKVKRTELLSAELMLHPIYLSIYLLYPSIYLSIELESSGASLPISPTMTQISEFRFHPFYCKIQHIRQHSESGVPKKNCHQNHSHHSPFPPQKKTHLIIYILYIYIYKNSKCSFEDVQALKMFNFPQTHQILFFGCL